MKNYLFKSLLLIAFLFAFQPMMANTIKHPSSREIPTTQTVYVVENALIDTNGECWTMRVNVVKIESSGQRLLVHTATIKVGRDCETDGEVISSSTYTQNDYVIEDERLNGSIIDFMNGNPSVVDDYVIARDAIINR